MSVNVNNFPASGTGLAPQPGIRLIAETLWGGAMGALKAARWLREELKNRKKEAELCRKYGHDGAVICQLLEPLELKESTIRTYIRQIHLFDRWLASNGYTDVDEHAVRKYLATKTGSTRSVALCALRAVYEEGLDFDLTTGLLHHPKKPSPARSRTDEVVRIIGAAETLTDILLVLVAHVFGLRPGQARELTWGDLHLSGNVLSLNNKRSVTGASVTLGEDALRKIKGGIAGHLRDERILADGVQ